MRIYESILAGEIRSYISGILESGRSIKNHEIHLGSLDRYLSERHHASKDIDEETAIGWLMSRNASRNYQVNILCFYRGFSNYLKAHGIMAFVPDAPQMEHTYIPYIYSEEEVERIFEVCDGLTVRYDGNRSPAMMSMLLRLLYGTGMRLGECLRLKSGQIDFNSGCILLFETKNNRERIIPLHPSLSGLLRRYAVAMGIAGVADAPLFPNKDGIAFSKQWATYWFRIILDRAGIRPSGQKKHGRGPCLHSFRHGYTYLALKQAKANGLTFDEAIPFISTYLGHKDVSDTDYYLKFSYALFNEEQDVFSDYTKGMFPEVADDEEE